MRFSWKMCVRANTIACNKARQHAAPLTFASFINPESWFVVKSGSVSSILSVDDGSSSGEETTNCWCTQTDTCPQYTSFSLLIPGKSLESQRGHFGQQPIRRHLHSSVEHTHGEVRDWKQPYQQKQHQKAACKQSLLNHLPGIKKKHIKNMTN